MVTTWGTGRKDYSSNVEGSVLPVIRSYQVNATAYETFTLAAGETKDVPITMDFSPGAASHFIFHIDVTVDANVLIVAEIHTVAVDVGDVIVTTEQGYQQIRIDSPQGLPLSTMTLRITNYGDVAVKGAYSHNGVQGTEKIMPTWAPS